MKKLKRFIALLLFACLAFTAVACGSNTDPDTPIDPDAPLTETKELTLQINTSSSYTREMWDYVISLYKKDHPNVKVTPYFGNTVNKQFQNKWRNGNPPDFVFLDGNNLDKDTMLKEGLLYDFTEWLETATVNGEDVKIKDKANLNYAFKNTNGSKTITYGMPLVISSYGMWYDEALFTQKGWSVPTNYSELKTFTKNKASKACPAVIFPGAYSGYLVQGFILPALAEKGDEFFDRVENAKDKEVFTSAEFKEVMNRFVEFSKLTNAYATWDDKDHIDAQKDWLNGKAALLPCGLWLESEMKKQLGDEFPTAVKMRYTSSPLVENQKILVTSAVTCGIASQAKNKKNALDFMTYLYRDDVAKRFVKATGSLSVVPVDLSGDTDISETFKNAQAVLSDTSYKQVIHVGSWGNIDSAFNDGVNSLIKGEITVNEFCQSLVERWEQMHA